MLRCGTRQKAFGVGLWWWGATRGAAAAAAAAHRVTACLLSPPAHTPQSPQIKNDELAAAVDEYEKGSRRPAGAKDSVLAAQQVQYLTEQSAMKDRQLVAKDRQLAALKAEREELSERLSEAERSSRPAGPDGETLDRIDLAERTVAALKRERDELKAMLEEGSRSGKAPSGKSIAEKLAVRFFWELGARRLTSRWTLSSLSPVVSSFALASGGMRLRAWAVRGGSSLEMGRAARRV